MDKIEREIRQVQILTWIQQEHQQFAQLKETGKQRKSNFACCCRKSLGSSGKYFRKQLILYLCFQMIFRHDEQFVNFSLSSILKIKHNKTEHDIDNY